MANSKILSGPYSDELRHSLTKILADTSLDGYLLETGKRRTNNIYLIDAASNEQLTTRDFLQKSHSLAAELEQLGCTKNTMVGILSANRSEYSIVILGTLMLGGVVTFLNPYHTVGELKLTYGITKPTIMFCSAENYEKLTHVAPTSTKIVVFDSNETFSVPPPSLSFSQLTQSARTFTPAKNGPDDVALILYSSGTTGLPKGVMLTHKNIVLLLTLVRKKEMNMTRDEAQVNRQAIRVTASPMFHVSGLICLFTALPEQTLIILEQFELKLYLSVLEKYKIQHIVVIPAYVVRLVNSSITDTYNLSSLRSAICAAGALKPELEKAFKEKFHLEYIEQIYGLSECTSTATMKNKNNMKSGTCGSVISSLQMKVVNPETGELLGNNEPGEIYLRGPLIMKGYYNDDQATADTLDKDGWLQTGDIGYYDEDGDVFIVDRIKDFIKYKSSQVAPTELEMLLETHPAVEDSAVIGIPDEDAGELPRAYVVKREGVEVTEDEIIEFVAGRISPRKRLHGGVEFVSAIPRNATGKKLRTMLRDSWKRTHTV